MNRITLLVILVLLVLGGIAGYALTHYKTPEEVGINPILSINAFNLTKNANAASVTAMPGDEITYSVSAENHTDRVIRGFVIQLDVKDISELASLVNAAGGNYNSNTGTLAWTPIDIQPFSAREKKFTVKVNKTFPVGSDLIMSVKYNNDLRVSVTTPTNLVVTNTRGNQVMGTSTSQSDFNAPVTGASNILEIIGAMIVTLSIFLIKLFKTRSVLA